MLETSLTRGKRMMLELCGSDRERLIEETLGKRERETPEGKNPFSNILLTMIAINSPRGGPPIPAGRRSMSRLHLKGRTQSPLERPKSPMTNCPGFCSPWQYHSSCHRHRHQYPRVHDPVQLEIMNTPNPGKIRSLQSTISEVTPIRKIILPSTKPK